MTQLPWPVGTSFALQATPWLLPCWAAGTAFVPGLALPPLCIVSVPPAAAALPVSLAAKAAPDRPRTMQESPANRSVRTAALPSRTRTGERVPTLTLSVGIIASHAISPTTRRTLGFLLDLRVLAIIGGLASFRQQCLMLGNI